MDLYSEKTQNKKTLSDKNERYESSVCVKTFMNAYSSDNEMASRNLNEHTAIPQAKIARKDYKSDLEKNINEILTIINQSSSCVIHPSETVRYIINPKFIKELQLALKLTNESENEIHIPPLSNREFLADHCVYTNPNCSPETLLKSDVEFGDVILVSESDWIKLNELIPSVDAEIPRKIINTDNTLTIELHPLKLWVMLNTSQNPHQVSGQPIIISVSRTTKIRLLQTEFEPSEMYIANCLISDGPPKSSNHVDNIIPIKNDMLDLPFHKFVSTSIAVVFIVPQESEGKDINNLRIDIMSGGLAGLQNYGNLCFMNSALQCLSHTMPLTQYFLTEQYKDDVNLTNPLGTKGKLVAAYVSFLKEAWVKRPNSSRIPVLNPDLLKDTISRFAPQFCGYQQQDSHELTAYLLDGLHEDLNRVKVKKYVEYKDDDDANLPDEKLAEISWERHKNYNNSIIVDIFQGLYRSRLECLECKHHSVAFDPFMYLSLPLPAYQTITVMLTVIPNNVALRWAVQFDINICFGDNLVTFKKQVAEKLIYIIKNSDIVSYFTKAVNFASQANSQDRALPNSQSEQNINKPFDVSFNPSSLNETKSATVFENDDPDQNLENFPLTAFSNKINSSYEPASNQVFHPQVGNQPAVKLLYNDVCDNFQSAITMSTNEILQCSNLSNNILVLKPSRSYRYWEVSSVFCNPQATVEESFANIIDPVYVYLLPTADVVNLVESIDIDNTTSDSEDSSDQSLEDNFMYGNLEPSISPAVTSEIEKQPITNNCLSSFSKDSPFMDKNPWILECLDYSLINKFYDKVYIFVIHINFSPRYPHGNYKIPTILVCFKHKVTCSMLHNYIFWKIVGLESKPPLIKITLCDPLGRNQVDVPYENILLQSFLQKNSKKDSQQMLPRTKSEIFTLSCASTSKPLKTEPILVYTWNQFTKVEKESIVDVKSCIREFLKQEQLGADNMWYCKKCKRQVQANKQLDIWQLPRIIVIQLKRFHQTTRHYRSKNNQFITLKPSEILDLSEFVQRKPHTPLYDTSQSSQSSNKFTETFTEDIQPSDSKTLVESIKSNFPVGTQSTQRVNSENSYKLFAISNHYGSLAGGHYTATVKCNFSNNTVPNWSWVSFDDSSVTHLSSESEICGKSAYLLFYERT